MAISSSGGADTVDTGGTLRATSGAVEDVGGVQRAVSEPGQDTTSSGADTTAGTGADTVAGTAGTDTVAGQETTSGTGTDTVAGTEGKDTVEGGRSDDDIRATLKEAGGIFADPRYEVGALEFEKTGDVTPETRAKLAADFNVPVNAIDSFIEGQKAQRAMVASTATAEQAKAIGEIQAVIGTEADYGKFMEWSKEALSDTEKNAYNEALDKAPAAAKVMLAGFNEKYKAAGNGAPRDLTDESQPGGAVASKGYASSEEMQTDMASPRYETDPAFRSQVAARVAVSKF